MRTNSVKLILNLGQRVKRWCLNDFLSGALASPVFGGAEPFTRHHRKHSCEVISNLDQWFRRRRCLKKKFMHDGKMTDKDLSQ